MIIKYPDLANHLHKNVAPFYGIIGKDTYVLEDSIQKIKTMWSNQGDYDEKHIYIQQPHEWADCFQEANHYTLFSSKNLLKIRYDKKTIDLKALSCIKNYLENPNSSCLILLEAPLISIKQLHLIAKHAQAVLIHAAPLSPSAFQLWIKRRLDEKGMRYEASVPNLIYQYNQNNMLAAIQVIETLALRIQADQLINHSILFEHLTDRCEYSLFELAEACLIADTCKALHLLRYLNQNKTEPSLVLWLITQEIHLLLQWYQLLKQATPFDMACKQLNIWPQRAKNYTMALQRLKLSHIHQLLIQCHCIDKLIKSAKTSEVWHALENVALGFINKP